MLAALAGAALFLCLAGCNGKEKAPEEAARPAAPEARSGIGPGAGGGLLYEEEPFPGFSDYIGQVDYAISRAVQLAGLKAGSLKSSQGELLEHDGHLYRPQIIIMSGVGDAPALTQALRDSLLAWAERAALVSAASPCPGETAGIPPKCLALQIVVDGAVTHHIFLSPLPKRPAPDGPKLVIVLDDLGESRRQARRLLDLGFPVTFAVWPHSTHAAAVAAMGRKAGAEVIIHQPMQPEGYPGVNPGPGVILEGMDEAQILAVLEDSLARVPQAEGLNNHMGSRLTQDEATMGVVSRWLAGRGLLALDSLTHARSRFSKAASEAGAQAYKRDVFLDVEADKAKIVTQLKKAEQIALVKGQAVAIGHPLATTLDALEEWQRERDQQISVVRLKDLTPIRSDR